MNTNSISDDWEAINMIDADSIWDYCFFEDSVDHVVNILQDNFTPLLTHHHYAIRNLSYFLDTASRDVPTNNVDADEDSMVSSNTVSTASLDELAISFFQVLGVVNPSLLLNLSKVQGWHTTNFHTNFHMTNFQCLQQEQQEFIPDLLQEKLQPL